MNKNLVAQETTTTGTYIVSGSIGGRQTFADAFANGDANIPYCVTNLADEWEFGLGTWTEGSLELSRDVVLSSTNSDAAVSWAAGTKRIYVVAHADVSMPAVRHTVSAVPPTVDRDGTEGYGQGSFWIDTGSGYTLFICVDASTGAAVWVRMAGFRSGNDIFTYGVTGEDNQRVRFSVAEALLAFGYAVLSTDGPVPSSFLAGSNDGGTSFGVGGVVTGMLTTTNATPANLAFEGDSGTHGGIPVGDHHATLLVDGVVTAVQDDGSAGKSWHIRGMAKSVSGTASLEGTPAVTAVDDFGTVTGWDVTLVVSGNDVLVQATGASSTNIAWSMSLNTARAGWESA